VGAVFRALDQPDAVMVIEARDPAANAVTVAALEVLPRILICARAKALVVFAK